MQAIGLFLLYWLSNMLGTFMAAVLSGHAASTKSTNASHDFCETHLRSLLPLSCSALT